MNLTVACVLRSGGHYDAGWVHRLKRGLNRYSGLSGHEFVCMTNMGGAGTFYMPLKYAWHGWWSKMELFRPGLFTGLVLYLDLDTLVTGDLTEIAAYTGEFAALSDFYRPKRAQSGVLLFRPGEATEALWHRWLEKPQAHRRKYRGDGQFIHAHSQPDRLQNLFPGQIVSLKVHAQPGVASGPPKGARLVCGHGKPRFDDPDAGWAHEWWQAA